MYRSFQGTSVNKTFGVLFPAILAQAAGNVFLSISMREAGGYAWLDLVPRVVGNPTLWLGTGLLIVSFLLFAAALSWADLSFVIPTVSIEVAVNVAFASYFLHEAVSLTRWMGVFLISIGVLLVVRSERRKSRQETESLRSDGER